MKTPKVGDGATLGVGSDCYPYTVVYVSHDGKEISVQEDMATPTPDCNHFGNQSYTYTSRTNGPITNFSLRKDGRYHAIGQPMKSAALSVGSRRFYQDPSF